MGECSCISPAHVMRNYLLYQMYHNNFAGAALSIIMRQYNRLVLNYFYVKHLLSVKSMQGDIDEQLVTATLASMSFSTLHSNDIDRRMDEAIDKINGGVDLFCLQRLS